MKQCFQVACKVFVMLASANVYAVVQLEVAQRDVPAMRGATFEVISVEGDEHFAETTENQRGGVIVLDYDAPLDARGSAVIITPGNSTPRFQITIPMDWDGSPLLVDFEQQTLRPSPATAPIQSSPAPRQIGLHYGYGRFPGTDWGTPAGIFRGAGNETRLLPAGSAIGTDQIGVSFETSLPFLEFARETDLRAGFRYWDFDGDESDTATAASGGEDVFSVFIGISDTFGTGFFGGPIGSTSRYDLDVEGHQYEVDFSWPVGFDWLGNVQMRPSFGVSWGEFDLDYEASAAFIDVPEVIVTTHQELNSDYWSANIGVDFNLPLSQRWSIQWGGRIRYQDIDSQLDSAQTIDFFGMPETILQEMNDDDTSLGIAASAGMRFQFNDNLGIAAQYTYDWNRSVPGGVNPISGTQVFEGQTSTIEYRDDYQLTEVTLLLSF